LTGYSDVHVKIALKARYVLVGDLDTARFPVLHRVHLEWTGPPAVNDATEAPHDRR